MLRTALQPKWLALLALVLAVIGAFTWLGLWQLNVAQNKGRAEVAQEAASAPESPVEQVLPVRAPFTGRLVGRKVHATGRYDTGGQLLVTGRRLGEATGFWVLTPLVLDSGATLPVVRGFVTSPQAVPPPPPGGVTVRGGLQPSEGGADRPTALPAGQVQTIDLATLVNTWDGDLVGGFVLATAEEPAPAAAHVGSMQRVPPPATGTEGIAWRNAFYALQWWVFAMFALYLWWRMVRDAHEDTVRATATADDDADVAAAEPTSAPEPSPTGSPHAGGTPS